jgi:hypothetical protein
VYTLETEDYALTVMPSHTRKRQDADLSSESDLELDKSCFSLASHIESSSDTEVEEELDSDTKVGEDADTKRDFLRQRKAFYKSQGRAKSKWLVACEFQKWEKSVCYPKFTS